MKYLVRIYEEEFIKKNGVYKYEQEFDTPVYQVFENSDDAFKYAEDPKCYRYYDYNSLQVPLAVIYELTDKQYQELQTAENEPDFTELDQDAEIYNTYTDTKSIEEIEEKDGIKIEF